MNACEGLTAPETQVQSLRKLATKCIALRRENEALLALLRKVPLLYLAKDYPELEIELRAALGRKP